MVEAKVLTTVQEVSYLWHACTPPLARASARGITTREVPTRSVVDEVTKSRGKSDEAGAR